MPESKSVNISLEEYHRLQEVEKRCEKLQSAFYRINDYYNELLDAQQLAAEKYRSTQDPSVKREGWTDWLSATMNFLRKMPKAESSANHMMTELLGCLGDVDEGRSSPLLKPANKKPTRVDTNHYVAELGMAVALVDILHDKRRGLPLEKAASKVVRLFKKHGLSLPKQIRTKEHKATIPKSLINWRRRMQVARKDSPYYRVAREIYHTVIERHRWLQDEQGHNRADANKILIDYVLPGLMGKKVH